MKALIKGGLCLALGWLANDANAQEAIQWRASAPKNSSPIAVVSAQVEPAAIGISLSRPTPLDAPAIVPAQASANVQGAFAPIIRAQAAEEKIGEPRPLPKGGKDFPPPPQPAPGPSSPGLDSISMGDCGVSSGACATSCMPSCMSSWMPRLGLGQGDCCPPRPLFWMSAEYLMWFTRAQSIPPLVTTSPAGTATVNTGVLGAGTTSVLFGDIPNHTHSGARFTVGAALPCFENVGVEATYFFLGRQTNDATFSSNGNPQISRPIFNAITMLPGSEIVAINNPDRLVTGSVSVHDYSSLWGMEANVRARLCCGPNYWLDLLAGYRYLSLSEGITITENLQNFDPITRLPAGNFLVQDSFATRNTFNGLQLGLDYETRFWHRMFLGITGKVAVGDVYQTININGSTAFSNFGVPAATFPGGLYALPGTNIGHYSQHRFGVLPEIGFKLGIDVTDHLRLFVGYDFMYLNSVVRPGTQIDQNVNPNFQPSAVGPGPGGGPRVPAVLFRTSDYWAQGLTFGLQYRY